jgi:hypothetical protein
MGLSEFIILLVFFDSRKIRVFFGYFGGYTELANPPGLPKIS